MGRLSRDIHMRGGMKPSTRVAKFLERCDQERQLRDSRDLLERLVIEAENDALLLASIELENNYFARFTQAEAAHTIRQMMHHK